VSANITFTDAANPNMDRGRAGIDRAHVFSGSLVYALPTLDDKPGLTKTIFGDWELSSIVSASTGYPLTVFINGVPGLNGGLAGTGFTGSERPMVVPGVSCRASGGPKEQWLNPAAWTINGMRLGTFGDSGR